MSLSDELLPIIAASQVLFPGDLLRLQVVEPAHLELIADCARQNRSFGVVLGRSASDHERVGTEATIVDFNRHENGLLEIACRGRRRFLIKELPDGQNSAAVRWFSSEPAVGVPPRCAMLQTLAQELLANRDLSGAFDADIEDASDLGMMLAATLAADEDHAQAMLAMTDPIVRLEALISLLGQAAAD